MLAPELKPVELITSTNPKPQPAIRLYVLAERRDEIRPDGRENT